MHRRCFACLTFSSFAQKTDLKKVKNPTCVIKEFASIPSQTIKVRLTVLSLRIFFRVKERLLIKFLSDGKSSLQHLIRLFND